LRPIHAYTFGLISQVSRFVFSIPFLRQAANFSTQAPLLRDAFKAVVGIAQPRRMPPFAEQSFKEWFTERMTARGWQSRDENGATRHLIFDPQSQQPRVILFPDTFNNYFHPGTAQAATEVLEAAGFSVCVPLPFLCCGRPLFDYGMLDTAKKWLLNILAALREEIRADTPLVVLEPSCATTFRDELFNLFPNDEDAKRLKQNTLLLSEFLQKHAPDWQAPKLHRKAIVHGHCHHKSVLKMHDEMDVLRRMEVDFHELDSGCCGMAGAFGFESGEHYDVSIKCGERVLLPAVRQADLDELVIADGFSCREQIAQQTERHALHLAEVLQMALREGESGPSGDKPEEKYAAHYAPQPSLLKTLMILGAVGLLLTFLLSLINATRKKTEKREDI
jgi:Fe-S oxidoreductase